MLIPDNIKCSFCSRIFCCPNCRKLHEEKEHVVTNKESIHKSCFICHGKAFPLQKSRSKLLMEHIVEAHMPLHCRKCNKIYNSKDDFDEIEKCVGARGDKIEELLEHETENKENIPTESEKNKTVPHKIIVEEIDEELLTPLSKINLKWRRKSAGLSISDSAGSVSSINQSNNSHLKLPEQSAAKLVRTTSTPMNQLVPKPGSLDSLCGSSYQASSIEPSSGNETDQSASITSNYSPSPAVVIKRHQFPMQRARSIKQRLSKAQTPLRQVMSKSIQRAIQEQRIERTKLTAHIRMPRKMVFDSMSSSDGSLDELSSSVPSKTPNVSGVLDLRTTPVLKRTNSCPNPRGYTRKEEKIPITFERHKSDESLIVEALIEEHYRRPDFRARIDAISDNVINETKYEPSVTPIPVTPAVEKTDNTNGIFQSCLEDDDTPFKLPMSKKSAIVTPMMSVPENYSFNKEVWYTPRNISSSVKLPESPETFKTSDPETENDDVFTYADENRSKEQPPSRIWRLFSTVFKMASGSLTDTTEATPPVQKPSLVKRSLSHLGLIRPVFKSPPTPILKRKRLRSSQTSLSGETSTIPELRSPVAKKYKSITGRKPIQRLRTQ